MLSTRSVWDRRNLEADDAEISASAYNMAIGLVLTWGLGINALMVAKIPAEVILGINHWVFLIGYLASVFFGTWLYVSSKKPIVSFVGYNFVVIPLGLLLVRFLYFFPADVISKAFVATAGVTVMMMLASMMYPKFFLSIGRTLFMAFIAAFVVELIAYFVTGSVPPIFDWIFVVIFSGYIGYDWARAQHLPKTLDNAVDAAAALYVDIVILFIRLVRIFGRR